MATIASATVHRWDWRLIGFRILAALFGLQSFLIGFLIIGPSPWRDPASLPSHLTRWHSGQSAVVVGLLSGVLLLLMVWRPRQNPVLLQLFGLVIIWNMIIALLRIQPLGFEPASWVYFALSVLMIALYPWPRALVSLSGDGPLSKPLLALTLAIGVLLLWDAGRNLQWQLAGIGGEPARRFFWLQTALLSATLAMAGCLTAIKRPGWQALGVLLGLTYIYLGIVALYLPAEPGSWGLLGGALAMVTGIGYCGLSLGEARRAATGHRPVVTGAEGG